LTHFNSPVVTTIAMFVTLNTSPYVLLHHRDHHPSLSHLSFTSRVLPFLLPLLLLSSFPSTMLVSAQRQDPAVSLITQVVSPKVNITSITGACGTQQGPSIINCTLGGTRSFTALTITGTGFATAYQNLVTIGGVNCASGYDLGVNTLIRCDLYDAAYPWPVNNIGDSYTTPLLPVVATNTITGASSQPAYLISFTVRPPVTVQSVSGCSDVGLTTTNCNTSTAVLTITGSGFVPDPPSVYQWTPYWPLATGSLTYRTAPAPLRFLNNTSTTVLMYANTTIGGSSFLLPNTGTLSFVLTHANYIANTALTIGFIPTSTNSAATAPSALAGNNFTISSISGCSIVENTVTLGCARPFTLTIQGSVFPNGVSLLISVGGERCYPIESTEPTLIFCQVQNSLTVTPTNVLLPVVIFDLFRNYQSPPFYGVQLATLQPPVLANISGCVGSGNMTSNCMVATDVLTIQGEFFVVDGSPWSIRVGSFGSPALPAGTILDTQTVVISFITGLPNSLSQFATSTGPLQVWLQHGYMMSNALTLSVAPATANITMISSFSCTPITNYALANCTPGASVVQITGVNFYRPLSVTIAGVACTHISIDYFLISCTLPALVGYIPNAAYALVLTQGDSPAVTLAGAISYLTLPSITTITSEKCPCPGCAGSFSLLCEQGATISLIGSFFSPSEQLTVFIAPQSTVASPTITCLSVTVQSSALLTCQLPSLNSTLLTLFSASWNAVQLLDTLNNVTSNVLNVGLYRPAVNPIIESVVGCSGADPSMSWAVLGCVTGNTITLQGANFGTLSTSRQAVAVYIYEPDLGVSYSCLTPITVSSTLITCVLPYIIKDGEEVLLPVRVLIANSLYSNWLPAISYSTGVNPTCSSSISSGSSEMWRTAFIVTVVLLSSLLALFAMFVVWMWRRGAIGGWKKHDLPTSYVGRASGGWESEREESMRRSFGRGRTNESAGVELQ
jgi:hypothetical protein